MVVGDESEQNLLYLRGGGRIKLEPAFYIKTI